MLLRKKYIENSPDFRETFYGVKSYLDALPRDIKRHYQEVEDNYSRQKELFLNGNLHYDYFTKYLELGGRPEEGNWSCCTDFPLELEHETTCSDNKVSFCYPLTTSGARFEYIGYIEPDMFGGNSCGLLLFYNEEEKIALNTFYWT